MAAGPSHGWALLHCALTPEGWPIRTREYFLPNRDITKRKMRACLNCGLIKHFLDFRRDGCNNCERFFRMRNNSDRVIMFTSLKYEGVVGLTEHCQTWSSRFFPGTIKSFCPGIYAVNVTGKISDRVMDKILSHRGYESDSEDQDDRNAYHRG